MSDDDHAHLLALLADFSDGMLVTRASNGRLEGRPMSIAEVGTGGALWFCAGNHDGKIAQMAADPDVAVMLQGKAKFVSVSGRAHVSRDRADIDRLWKEPWKLWFPQGKDDPTLCLLVVQPVEAQFWDNSGVRGLRFLFEAAKAYVTGREVEAPDGENARVKM
jgi:general stress protein 26